jgi:hypothetical protein
VTGNVNPLESADTIAVTVPIIGGMVGFEVRLLRNVGFDTILVDYGVETTHVVRIRVSDYESFRRETGGRNSVE